MRYGWTWLIFVPAMAAACLNDRDTLGYELRNKPDVQRALTGRFDRFPKLYYQIRIARLLAQARLTSSEVDDLAVAYDRIGLHRIAIAAIDDPRNPKRAKGEETYRYHANKGTFLAHDWISAGRPPAQAAQLERAIQHIQKALAIKPDAHFGREAVQLSALQWIQTLQNGGPSSLGNYIASTCELDREQVVRGMAGLIMLGNAWQSPDFAAALGVVMMRRDHQYAAPSFAFLRASELIRQGAKPLERGLFEEDLKQQSRDSASDRTRFHQLRAEAEQWHAAKMAFLNGQLLQGNHPDIDPNFWADYHESPMPVLPTEAPFWQRSSTHLFALAFVGISAVVGILYQGLRAIIRGISRFAHHVRSR